MNAVPPLVAPPSQARASRGADTPLRDNGRTRLSLLRCKTVQEAAPRGIHSRALSPFHQTGALYADGRLLLFLILALYVTAF